MTESERQEMYVAELVEQISQLQSTCVELSKRVVYTEKEKDSYWEIDCDCGFIGLSMFANGGSQIADTGDYGACYCPCCGETVD